VAIRAGNKEGYGEGGKGNRNDNEDGGQQRGQWQGQQGQWERQLGWWVTKRAMTRAAGDDKGGKGYGDSGKSVGQEMVMAIKRSMATTMRVAGNKEGDCNKEGNGNSNKGGRQERGQWQGWQEQWQRQQSGGQQRGQWQGQQRQ
jgi:hypothetical protein